LQNEVSVVCNTLIASAKSRRESSTLTDFGVPDYFFTKKGKSMKSAACVAILFYGLAFSCEAKAQCTKPYPASRAEALKAKSEATKAISAANTAIASVRSSFDLTYWCSNYSDDPVCMVLVSVLADEMFAAEDALQQAVDAFDYGSLAVSEGDRLWAAGEESEAVLSYSAADISFSLARSRAITTVLTLSRLMLDYLYLSVVFP
jgi:hypothetical protein